MAFNDFMRAKTDVDEFMDWSVAKEMAYIDSLMEAFNLNEIHFLFDCLSLDFGAYDTREQLIADLKRKKKEWKELKAKVSA